MTTANIAKWKTRGRRYRAARPFMLIAFVLAAGLGSEAAAAQSSAAQEASAAHTNSAANVRPDDPDREILEVIEAFNGAFAANDTDRYFAFIDEEITVLTPSNPYRVEGKPDDREEFEWGIRTGRNRVGYFQEMQPYIQRYGDVAVVTYFSRGSYGGADGDAVVAYLKETNILVKRAGEWKVVHIHVSATDDRI